MQSQALTSQDASPRVPQPPAKVAVKFRVSFVREPPKVEPGKEAILPEQTTFFTVDRASLLRLVPLLLWDTTVTSVYVDDFEGTVVEEKVRR